MNAPTSPLTPADAVGMRRSAVELLARSDRLGAVIGRLDAQLGSMGYAGPAADRFRLSMGEKRRVTAEAQRILREAAEVLNRTAAATEASASGRIL